MGTPNREPQEYSRNIIGMYVPGSLYSIKTLGCLSAERDTEGYMGLSREIWD